MELRGRLPASTRLATVRPSGVCGRNEKSVSWLFNRNPPTISLDPNALSMLVVIEAALPSASTMLM